VEISLTILWRNILEKFSPGEEIDKSSEIKKEEMASAEDPLTTAYRLVHEEDPPADMPPIEVAFAVLEVLDNPNWIPRDLAIECGEKIMGMRKHDDSPEDDRAVELIRNLEEGIAQNLFPELKNIDEVHYTQWAYQYRKHHAEGENSGIK
jgi:hypothetical protein